MKQEYDLIQKRIDRLFDLHLDDPTSITKEMYANKLNELKEKQVEITAKLQQYTQADENYYITASTILNLAQRALEIFNNSEVLEKRQLLNFLLQNPQLKGRELVFTLKTPFDRVLEANRCCEMLPSWDDFRTLRWEEVFKYPEVALGQIRELVGRR